MRLTSLLRSLLCSLVLWSAANAQTCPATTNPGAPAANPMCPAGNCKGECVMVRQGAAGTPGACGGSYGGLMCDGTNQYCVQNKCLQISTDTTACGAAGTCRTPMYCVNGECLMHGAMGATCAGDARCSGAGTPTTHICFTGCISRNPSRDMNTGPCSATPCGPPGGINMDGTACSMICLATPPPLPTCQPTMPLTGVCVAPAPAAPPSPCGVCAAATDMCVQNACVKRTPSTCSTPCPAMTECIFSRCVPTSTACATTCMGTDMVCVTGCVPVDATACKAPTPGPCTGGMICVPACVAPGGTTTIPPRLRCQDPATNKTTEAATACEDTGDMTECMRLFPDPSTSPTGPAPGPATGPVTTPTAVRSPNCDNELLREAAKRCAKSCKICCELPAYSCKDETIPAGAPTCAQNKASGFCMQEGLKPLMQKLCPATCGLCNTTGTAACSDKQDGCFSLAALCLNTQSNAFMKQNCAKTCDTMYPNQGFCPATGTPGAPGTAPTANTGQNCDVNSQLCNNPLYRDLMTQYCCATCNRCGQTVGGTAGSNTPNCQDQSSACVNWNARGFCRSTFYPDTMKRQQCSRTCGYCT